MRARIVMVKDDSAFMDVSAAFLNDFGQTNGGVPISIDCPPILQNHSGHVSRNLGK